MCQNNKGYLTPECESCPYWCDGETWDLGCSSEFFKDCIKNRKAAIEEQNSFLFMYTGPVIVEGQVACRSWNVRTSAVSKEKARNNLIYRWKNEHGMSMSDYVTIQTDQLFVIG